MLTTIRLGSAVTIQLTTSCLVTISLLSAYRSLFFFLFQVEFGSSISFFLFFVSLRSFCLTFFSLFNQPSLIGLLTRCQNRTRITCCVSPVASAVGTICTHVPFMLPLLLGAHLFIVLGADTLLLWFLSRITALLIIKVLHNNSGGISKYAGNVLSSHLAEEIMLKTRWWQGLGCFRAHANCALFLFCFTT